MKTPLRPPRPSPLATVTTAVQTTARAAGFAGAGMAIIRALTGYLWYTQLSWKVPWTTTGRSNLHAWVVSERHHALIPVYRDVLAQFILPHVTFVAYLTYFTEALLAISLIFGILTRLGGLVGTLWALQLYIGLSSAPGEWYWTYGMLVLINAVVWVAATGRWWGVDQWLRPRLVASAQGTSRMQQQVARWLMYAT